MIASYHVEWSSICCCTFFVGLQGPTGRTLRLSTNSGGVVYGMPFVWLRGLPELKELDSGSGLGDMDQYCLLEIMASS
jgi:hypothetical protein